MANNSIESLSDFERELADVIKSPDKYIPPITKIKPGILERELTSKLGGNFKGRDILSFSQFDPYSIAKVFRLTYDMRNVAAKAKPLRILAGTVNTLLFYEPSTRTRASFQAAINQLGGDAIVVTDPQNYSSVAKGETFTDTIRTFEAYGDTIILRHPTIGSAIKAAETARYIPIINAGDGPGEHPTQTLLDLFTIWDHHKRLTRLRGVVAGDIKNGRTVHSLLDGLALFPDNEVYLLSPQELRLQNERLQRCKDAGLTIHEIDRPEDIPVSCDFWYWTRVQKERFATVEEYLEVNNKFIVTREFLQNYGSADMILMHPLPRVGEITPDVDTDSRAVYLGSQVRNGMYTRMALLSLVLGKDTK